MTKFLRKLISLILVVNLMSCSSFEEQSPERTDRNSRISSLEAAIKTFSNSVKFAYYDEVFRFQQLPGGNRIDYQVNQLTGYRVVDYKNLSKLLSDDGINARVVSELKYYHIDDGKLKQILFEQSWWYNPIRNKWFLKTPFPLFDENNLKN